MIAAGTVVEVGQLNADGDLGVIIERRNGEFITTKGLTEDETRAVAALFYQQVTVTLASAAETPP